MTVAEGFGRHFSELGGVQQVRLDLGGCGLRCATDGHETAVLDRNRPLAAPEASHDSSAISPPWPAQRSGMRISEPSPAWSNQPGGDAGQGNGGDHTVIRPSMSTGSPRNALYSTGPATSANRAALSGSLTMAVRGTGSLLATAALS